MRNIFKDRNRISKSVNNFFEFGKELLAVKIVAAVIAAVVFIVALYLFLKDRKAASEYSNWAMEQNQTLQEMEGGLAVVRSSLDDTNYTSEDGNQDQAQGNADAQGEPGVIVSDTLDPLNETEGVNSEIISDENVNNEDNSKESIVDDIVKETIETLEAAETEMSENAVSEEMTLEGSSISEETDKSELEVEASLIQESVIQTEASSTETSSIETSPTETSLASSGVGSVQVQSSDNHSQNLGEGYSANVNSNEIQAGQITMTSAATETPVAANSTGIVSQTQEGISGSESLPLSGANNAQPSVNTESSSDPSETEWEDFSPSDYDRLRGNRSQINGRGVTGNSNNLEETEDNDLNSYDDSDEESNVSSSAIEGPGQDMEINTESQDGF